MRTKTKLLLKIYVCVYIKSRLNRLVLICASRDRQYELPISIPRNGSNLGKPSNSSR